jgi:hypothetical protein
MAPTVECLERGHSLSVWFLKEKKLSEGPTRKGSQGPGGAKNAGKSKPNTCFTEN